MADASAAAAAAAAKPPGAKAAPVLPWMRVPIAIRPGSGVLVSAVGGLDERLKEAVLTGLKFTELFPVQSVMWQQVAGGASTAHDLCVAAPTGSGKTLAYALPVVNGLATHYGGSSMHCLRALVVLPTRDLAAQVFEVFQVLCSAVRLNVALVAARSLLATEARELVGPDGSEYGGADVAVVTPGRLMAHLQGTPGFTLRHMRFLVVDEIDRLLRQSYQEWLPHVLAELSTRHFSHNWPLPAVAASGLPCSACRPVKIVVSATLTRDPAKLQRLALHCPRYVATSASDHRYLLPRSLQEFKLLCSGARKPLTLLALLNAREVAGASTIVFTSSLDMTHKLFLMLHALESLRNHVVEYSSLLPVAERAANLAAFKAGKASMLVASDAMTRGMDVDNVQVVINYDAPVYAKTYVHRAGRTARAGRSGRVFTLLRDEDMRHFKQMIRKADNNYVQDYKMQPEQVDALKPAVQGALVQVQALLAAERQADELALRNGASAGTAAGMPQPGPGGGRKRATAAAVAALAPAATGGEGGGSAAPRGHEAGEPAAGGVRKRGRAGL